MKFGYIWPSGFRGWLVGCFGFNGPLRQYFSLYRAVSQREGERGEKGQMRLKMSKQPPPAPTASAVGPCPTGIKIVGRPGTGSLPSTIAPPNHPRFQRRSRLKVWTDDGRTTEASHTISSPDLRLRKDNSFLLNEFNIPYFFKIVELMKSFEVLGNKADTKSSSNRSCLSVPL